jgi:hypothetical protein
VILFGYLARYRISKACKTPEDMEQYLLVLDQGLEFPAAKSICAKVSKCTGTRIFPYVEWFEKLPYISFKAESQPQDKGSNNSSSCTTSIDTIAMHSFKSSCPDTVYRFLEEREELGIRHMQTLKCNHKPPWNYSSLTIKLSDGLTRCAHSLRYH